MSIIEVAKLAGVSHATVSRVINNKDCVSEDSSRRVREAMDRLNYTPPLRRRGPRPKPKGVSSQIDSVAMLMFGTDPRPVLSPVSSLVIGAVEHALAKSDISLVLSQVNDPRKLPAALMAGRIGGLILHGNVPDPRIAQYLKRHPAVWVMSPRNQSGYWGDRVAPNNFRIGQMAAEYFLERGHQSMAFIMSARSDNLGFATRAQGFMQTASAAGARAELLEDAVIDLSELGDVRAERKHIGLLIDRFMALPDRPTGLFVPRGQATVMVYEALRERGVTIGDEGVKVLACDLDPSLASINPSPDFIDVCPGRVGEVAVKHLLSHLKNRDLDVQAVLSIEPRLTLASDG
ncbi:MAG: LacI family DNA-binding transcriptional regulator [Planctomycetota bacterium]